MDENKTPDVIIEDETTQEDVLSKLENTSVDSKKKKTSSTTKTLIIAICVMAVLAGALLALLFIPKGGEEKKVTNDTAAVSSKIDKKKVHQNKVKTKNGEIKKNGSGELLSMVPADIKTIKLENEKGTTVITSYTPIKKEKNSKTGKVEEKTEATKYTVKGYKDFDLQTGEPDAVANTCSTLSFKSVSCVDASDKLSDYGFDKPRCVATVTYSDGTKAVIKVGDNAPQNLGTYVMFGDENTVYLCETDTVKPLLFGVTDLISLTINNAAQDTEKSSFSKADISGANFSKNIVIEPNKDSEIESDYVLTSPSKVYADNTEASNVSGGIRGLYADSVKAVNPSGSLLSQLGLSSPYAEITAVYPDETVSLKASKPDSNGSCYLMKKDGKIVYTIKAEKIAWVNTSYEKLISEYVLNVGLSSIKSLAVDNYKFDVTTKTVKTTDDKGEESSTTETTTKFNGKKLDEGNFEILFNNISLLKKQKKIVSAASGKPALTVTYSYSSGRSDDKLEFVKNGGTYVVSINGVPSGTVNSSYVEKLNAQAQKVSTGKTIKSFW